MNFMNKEDFFLIIFFKKNNFFHFSSTKFQQPISTIITNRERALPKFKIHICISRISPIALQTVVQANDRVIPPLDHTSNVCQMFGKAFAAPFKHHFRILYDAFFIPAHKIYENDA